MRFKKNYYHRFLRKSSVDKSGRVTSFFAAFSSPFCPVYDRTAFFFKCSGFPFKSRLLFRVEIRFCLWLVVQERAILFP